MRPAPPISDDDFAKLQSLAANINRVFAEMIVENTRQLCDYKAVFGIPSRVVKYKNTLDNGNEVYRSNMFEGKALIFDVEYDPRTKEIIRVI